VVVPERKKTVLVVDDDEAIRRLVAQVLRSGGHDVVVAADGRDALSALSALPRPPDLLLTDVVMPGMKGPELVRALRERLPALRVVFMSGYAGDVLRRCDLDGAAFLPKPFTPAAVLGLVERVLDGDPSHQDGARPC